MVGRIDTSLGEITIGKDAIAKIAGQVAINCYGVVGMARRSRADGFVALLKAETMTKGVKVSFEGESLSISMSIMVEYGVNIDVITKSIIKNVKYQIKNMTGFDVEGVNITVESVRVNI